MVLEDPASAQPITLRFKVRIHHVLSLYAYMLPSLIEAYNSKRASD